MIAKNVFKLYCENFSGLRAVVRSRFDDFTLTYCTGFYNGQQEQAVVITIIGGDHEEIRGLAISLKRAGNQQSVLITYAPVIVEVL